MAAYLNDTIAAISTAVTDAGIGIVRISGEDACSIADHIYIGKKGKKLAAQKGYTIHYGWISDGEETIDEVLVTVLRSPHSYTGEDTVEINCHGGVYVLQKILELAIRSGARVAEPGEFTKRAFLNGRMDLSQAEAVMDLIEAKNEYALKSSVNQLKGSIKKKISDIRNIIIYHTAYIESALDDPEHISVDGYGAVLEEALQPVMKEIREMIDSFDDGRIVKEGIKTVILGRPNAGKSSLLNALLGEERAIVTDIAGTTRDILEEQIRLSDITLHVVDTAGIRDTEDVIEKIGVDRALKSAEDADLIIYVMDSSALPDENDERILSILDSEDIINKETNQNRKPAILLLNKSDLTSVVSKDNIHRIPGYESLAIPVIEISAKTGEGIDTLEETIKEMFFHGKITYNSELFITNIRHKAALEEAEQSLKQVLESIRQELPEDFYSIDLMDAYEALGRITGETIGDDLADEIFAKFCMGK